MTAQRFAYLSVAFGALLSGAVVPSLSAQETPPKDGVSVIGRFNGTDKLRIVVNPVKGANGDSIAAIIARDLDYSDRFIVMSSSAVAMSNGPLNYAYFAQLGLHGVVEASVTPAGALHVELHDVGNKLIVQKGDYSLPGAALGKDWRMAMHGVSDTIEEWATGQRGIAQTRIAYVRDNRVWVVDSDGANATAVTPRGLSPNWTPNGRSLVYSIIDGESSPIMVTELATGAQRALTSMKSSAGQDYAPVVTPDGRTVVFTRSGPTGAELYSMPISGGTPQRLTSSRGKDSGQPTVSPDGRRIAFASTRAGNNDVYAADFDGSNVELLAPGGAGEKTHNTPDWSPDGRMVAYTSGIGGTQQIVVLNVREQTTRQITDQSRNDDPSWAPDSRHLVVTSLRGGTQQIWVIDTQSGKARQLTRGSAARLAAWSPRLSGTP